MSNAPTSPPPPSYGQPAPQPQNGSNATKIVLIVLGVVGVLGLIACAGMAALLYPAVDAARTAARRVQSSNNLKQIGLALHNYHAEYNEFPPAVITGEDGRPLLSWRVALLPYLEQEQLYARFDLSEAWDGPTNGPLLEEMPELFNSASVDTPAGETVYLAVRDPEAVFTEDRAISFRQITDGTANTAMVVESATAAPWSAPEDLSIDEAVAELTGGAARNVLFVDGSVRHAPPEIDPETARATFTRAGDDRGGF